MSLAPQTVGHKPGTVIAAKKVDLALVSYVDESGRVLTQLAIVGDNTVHLLESRHFGVSKETTPQGIAHEWLKNGVLEKMHAPSGN